MRRASLSVAAVVATLVAVAPAGAATISVNTTVDVSSNNDALCSLREAVTAAQKNDINPNNCTDGDEDAIDKIRLDASGTYQLGGAVEDNNVAGDLDFNTDDAGVEIEGDLGFLGFPLDVIDGGGDDRVLHFRSPFHTAIIDGVQIENGNAQDDSGGGGIRSREDVSLTVEGGTVITDNVANGSSGGGILSWGPLVVRDSVVAGNTAQAGGGISESGPITMDRSVVSENVATAEEDGDVDGLSGSGLVISGGVGDPARITDSTIADNRIVFDDPSDVGVGGGIHTGAGTVMRGTTVSGNTVVGTGIFTHGAGVLIVAEFNEGGFVAVNSTISGNDGGATGSEGGGVWAANGSPAVFIHSTIKGNTANAGPGVFNNGGVVQLRGALVDQGSNACSGTITANAYNADAGNSCVGAQGDTDRAFADLFIGGFGFNGGLTSTWVIGPTSDALDLVPGPACDDLGATALAVDQRGAERPTGAGCDAGAYERVTCQGAVPTRLGGPGADSINGTAGADVIVGSAGNDTLAGAGANDRICGGSGEDVISDSAGADWLEGQAGGDTLLARDGIADLRVDCGDGPDGVSADPGLDSPIGCETDLDALTPQATPPQGTTPPRKCRKKRTSKRSALAAKKKRKKCKRKKRR